MNVPSVPSSPFWLFDHVKKKWTAIITSPNPGAVSYASVTSLNSNSVMLLGGLANDETSSGVWVLKGQTWVNSSVKLPVALYAHTTVVIDNAAYIFGGGNAENGMVLNTLHTLQVQNGSVVGQVKSIPQTGSSWPASRFSHTAVTVKMNDDEVMAVYGGAQQDMVLGDLWVYNPRTSQWTELYSVECGASHDEYPPQLYSHAAVALSSRKMAIVGGIKCNYLNEKATYVYDFSSRNWSLLPTTDQAAVNSMSIGWITETSTILLFGGGQPLTWMQPACTPPLVAAPSFATGSCEICPNGTFSSQGSCSPCPPGTTSGPGMTSIDGCIPCAVGKYLSHEQCVDCPPGLSTVTSGTRDIAGCIVCQNDDCTHGSCYVKNVSPTCICDRGYFGDHCQVR